MAIYDGKILAKRARESSEARVPTSYKNKAASDNIQELDAWAEMEKVLAVCRATAMDAGVYLVIQKALRNATRAVYAEGFDDGFHMSQEED